MNAAIFAEDVHAMDSPPSTSFGNRCYLQLFYRIRCLFCAGHASRIVLQSSEQPISLIQKKSATIKAAQDHLLHVQLE